MYLGARTLQKAEEAVASLPALSLAPLVIDPGFDASVASAAASLSGVQLYAIVNNAGTGLGHKTTGAEVLNVNAEGPKRVTEAFLPLLAPGGRVVNVGSGAASSFVKTQPPEVQKLLCNPPDSWDPLAALLAEKKADEVFMKEAYPGPLVSARKKAARASEPPKKLTHTLTLNPTPKQLRPVQSGSRRLHDADGESGPILFSCVSPGFIETRMTAGLGASKQPAEGTVSTRHALFAPLDGNGWYYGSDAVRSPYHYMRNPGEPAYDGIPPF